MKIKDILEGTVATGNFGKGKVDVSNEVDVPKGYKSFYVRPSKTGKVGTIVGVKDDGSEKDLSSATIGVADALCKIYNSGGKSDTVIKKMSLSDLAPEGHRIVRDLGFKWNEKPDYFDYVRKENPISELDLQKIKNAFKKAGLKLDEFTPGEVFAGSWKPDTGDSGMYPSLKAGAPQTFVLKYPSGNRYLVDRTGASTYLRMWIHVKDK